MEIGTWMRIKVYQVAHFISSFSLSKLILTVLRGTNKVSSPIMGYLLMKYMKLQSENVPVNQRSIIEMAEQYKRSS